MQLLELSEFSVPPPLDDRPHVWRARLGEPAGELTALLSLAERQRAEQFRRPADRQRYCRVRGLLRRLLASYLSTEPAELYFEYNPQGKPRLAGQSLQFNVTHTEGLALFAIARQPVGIDTECLRTMASMRAIAERYFAGDDVRQLLALPDGELPREFFRVWTAREALGKWTGIGLSEPGLEGLALLPIPAKLQWNGHCVSLRSWEPEAGYIAALAWADENPQ